MELITLYKGEKKAVVEKGSPGEAELKAIGFSDKQVKSKAKPKAK